MSISELQTKFDNSGVKGPIISDEELREFAEKLLEFAEFVRPMGYHSLAGNLHREYESVQRMLMARQE